MCPSDSTVADRSGAGGGRGLQAAGCQAAGTAGSGEKLSQLGLSHRTGFLNVFLVGELRAQGECGK